MGLFQKAYETYENHSHLAGIAEAGKEPLIPVSHTIQNAAIEITLDRDGNFIMAAAVDAAGGGDKDNKTIIPVSEDSAARTSSPKAHPLCEQVKYVAELEEKLRDLYLSELKEWTESEFSHPKVQAVLSYVSKKTILKDLSDANIIKIIDGKVNKPDLLIRWRVLETGEKDACWQDKSLMDAYVKYYESQHKDDGKAVCLITGKSARYTEKHSKGILPFEFGAKLISSNDSTNFVYRGRFSEAKQAAVISYEASQKAHNALRWVVANYGVHFGGRSFVCWNPKGRAVPHPARGVMRARGEEKKPTSPAGYKKELAAAVHGWQAELLEMDDVVIAAFDAATTGRLSITYYAELKASDFLERLKYWQEHCFWGNENRGYSSPSVDRIVKHAFGVERGDYIELDDKIFKEHIQRLLHCVVDKALIPQDIVRALTQKASTPMAYDKDKGNRDKVLNTACAVIYAYRTTVKKEEWSMALEPDKKDRSYQFGRLLAAMEKVEKDTYGRDEDRETNAVRMQAVFCDRPMYAAAKIDRSLQPYFERLKPGARAYYKKLIGEIMEALSEYDEKELNRSLDDSYLMGYYLQRNEFYRKKTDEQEEE